MKFSIIIPVYNCEKKMHICIESILGQTFRDWELILVNDGSRDNSLSECNKYANSDSRIKVISQDNKGPASARNNGIQYSKGEYLLFCDADDQLEERALEKIVEQLEKDVDIIFFGYSDAMIEQGKIVVLGQHQLSYRQLESNEELKKEFVKLDATGFTYPVWNKVYRSEFIKECRAEFPEGINVAEDFIFNIQLYTRVNNIIVLDECLYNYIHHKDSITSTFNKNKIENVEFVYLYAMEHLAKWNSEMSNRLHNAYIRDVNVFINNMFNKGVDLTLKEKYKLVKMITEKESVQQCGKEICCLTKRNKIMKALLKYKFVGGILLIGKMARLR